MARNRKFSSEVQRDAEQSFREGVEKPNRQGPAVNAPRPAGGEWLGNMAPDHPVKSDGSPVPPPTSNAFREGR